jgi:two-component system, NtrC family, sensor kinase
LDESLPEIIADHEKLKQVFMNLLMNAQQAVVRDGSISIRTSVESGKLVVRVQDSGCGIPTEMIDKIFDPFFSTKPVGEGTGLGLSLSYGIIQDHGGEINVESLQGHGTTFIIIFPTERAPENILVYSRS